MLAQFLENIFSSMAADKGISEDVLHTYLQMLNPYFSIILVTFLIMLFLWLISIKLSKRGKRFIRVQSFVAFLLITALTANAICYGPMYTIASDYLDGNKQTVSEDSKKESQSVMEAVGEEGIVLLKNSGNILPFDENTRKLNVFGWASTAPVYGGNNDKIDTKNSVSILESLESAGYEVNQTLVEMYQKYYDGRPSITEEEQDFTLPEPTEDYYTEAVMEEAKEFSDTAVIVLARAGAEGEDLPLDMNTIIKGTAGNVLEDAAMASDGADEGLLDGEDLAAEEIAADSTNSKDTKDKDTKDKDTKDKDTKDNDTKKDTKEKEAEKVQETAETEEETLSDNGAYNNAVYHNNGYYDDFEEGSSYLEPSNTEEMLIDNICSQFAKVIVIVNANNAMELGWVDDYEQIQAVLSVPGAGECGFSALGKILSGEVNPSGKTADTYVKDLSTAPYVRNIGYHTYVNGDDLATEISNLDATYQGNISYVDYNEGIYVGYKYYETAAKEKLIKYKDVVQYPFGYGLSYTTFEEKIENFSDNVDTISFDVTVTNTGDVSGKDVVEIYYTPPYQKGGIEKSAVNLLTFGKTGELASGKSETLSFEVSKEEMASYDANEKKVKDGGYVLEKGNYVISLRSDSHTIIAEEKFQVDEDELFENGRKSDSEKAVNQFSDRDKSKYTTYLSRNKSFKNYEEACEEVPESRSFMSDKVRKHVGNQTVVGYESKSQGDSAAEEEQTDAESDEETAEEEGTKKKDAVKLADYVGTEYDDASWDDLLEQMSFEDMATLINLGGWQTAKIDSISKIQTSESGDTNGLYNPVTETKGSVFTTAVLMAQTWNKDLIRKVGEALGNEYAEVGNYGWYGPSLNIHRSAFSGENYDNFSEDSILTGTLASAMINGAAEKGVFPYLKYFGLNQQETNKNSILLNFANEQSIREIYLKPFEIAVKNYKGKSLAVMTSNTWISTVPSCADGDLLNQVLRNEWGFRGMVTTDINESYGFQITDQCIRNGCDLMLGFNSHETNLLSSDGKETNAYMKTASKNILYTIVNSGNYENGDGYGQMSELKKAILMVDGIVLLLIIILEVIWLTHRGPKKDKNKKEKNKKSKKASKKNKKKVKDTKPEQKVEADVTNVEAKEADDITWIGFEEEDL